MKLIALATAGFLLCLTTLSAAAEDVQPAVKAAMTVYTHIVGTEAIIDMCRRTDITDAASYDKVYQTYKDEVRNIVMKIGFLVGRESQRAGIDKRLLFKSLDTLIDETIQAGEQIVLKDPERFALQCKILPNAIIEKNRLFEPLTMKFPREMKIIQRGL